MTTHQTQKTVEKLFPAQGFSQFPLDSDLKVEQAWAERRRGTAVQRNRPKSKWSKPVKVSLVIAAGALVGTYVASQVIDSPAPAQNSAVSEQQSEAAPPAEKVFPFGMAELLGGSESEAESLAVMGELLHAQNLYSDAHGSIEEPDFASVEELLEANMLPSTFNNGEHPLAIQLDIYERADGDGEGFYARGIDNTGAIYAIDDAGAGVLPVHGISHDYGKALDRFGTGR